MRRFLYDTAIFLYAVGAPHLYQEPCRQIVRLGRQGTLLGEASVELVQEYAHVRLRQRIDRGVAIQEARFISRAAKLHEITPEDIDLSLWLLERHQRLDARDAVHAATALNRGIPAIIATDRAFDDVPGLERVDPVDAERVLLA